MSAVPVDVAAPAAAPATTRVQVLAHPDLCPQGLSFEARSGRKLVDELLKAGIPIEHACERCV